METVHELRWKRLTTKDQFRVERWRRGRNKTEMFADTLIELLGLGTNYVISSLDSNLRLEFRD